MRPILTLLLAGVAATTVAQPPRPQPRPKDGTRVSGLVVRYAWDQGEEDEYAWPGYSQSPAAGPVVVVPVGGSAAAAPTATPFSRRPAPAPASRPATSFVPPVQAGSAGQTVRPAVADSPVAAAPTVVAAAPRAVAPPVVAPAAAAGKSRAAGPAPQPGDEVMVFARPGADGAALARLYGLASARRLNADSPDVWVLRAADPAAAVAARGRLAADPLVTDAFNLYPGVRLGGRAFAPNDPFFFPGPNPPVGGPGSTGDASFPGQWHLINTMPATTGNNPAISAGLAGAWANDFTGTGVTIAVVDDAVQVAHPDLQPNNAAVSGLNRYYDANGSQVSTDPNPPGGNAVGDHGTAVAGVAAARGGNGLGVAGAAPLANLVGVRTDYTLGAVVAAYGLANGPGAGNIQVKNHSYGVRDPFVAGAQPLAAAIRNSALAGTVNVVSAGNYRGGPNADVNKAYPQNTPHAVVIAALGSNGTFTEYSSFGASLAATAPSGTFGNGFAGLPSADRTGAAGYNVDGTNNYANTDYLRAFSGTSASAPVAAGVIAATLQANPALVSGASGERTTTRAVKHLLARTSTVVDAADSAPTSDGGWRVNAAGFRFNQNYGFGLVNAAALTAQAPLFAGVTPLTTATTGTVTVTGGAIPDENPTGISRTATISVPAGDRQPLEEVSVTLNVTHPYTADLTAFVTAPSGYRSRLFAAADGGGTTDLNWTFVTNALWGETQVDGTWTVTVADVVSGDEGTWNSFAIDLRMGTLVPVPEPAGVLLAGGLLVMWRRRG